MSNIVSIKIKNFACIGDVEIHPGQINQITGQNGQGKTSILEAFKFAFAGSGDRSLIKLGEDQAEVTVELADETTIRRRLTAKGSFVEVRKAGMIAPAPQSYLNNLFTGSSFNPIELLEPGKRQAAILESIPIKTSAEELSSLTDCHISNLPPLDYEQHGLKVIEQAHKYFYQRRAEANREAIDKQKKWSVNYDQLGTQPVARLSRADISERVLVLVKLETALANEIQEIKAEQAAYEAAEKKVSSYKAAMVSIETEIEKCREAFTRQTESMKVRHKYEIEKLMAAQERERQIADGEFLSKSAILTERKENGRKAVQQAVDSLTTNNRSLEHREEDLAATRAEIEHHRLSFKEVELLESWSKQKSMIDKMNEEFQNADRFANELTRIVAALAGPVKKSLMSKAEMPVAGLTYVDGEFFVNGVSVDRLSTSESIVIAVSVARKLAKSSKVICIDGAEALDESTWAALSNQIRDDGYTYFVTKVGEPFAVGGDKNIQMSHGEVLQ